ncbi:TPA: exodeoxyribonuclease V subunit beta, partial [Pseudomonas aeruginosa]
QGRHYNLERNFRSSQNMVDAVNELFLRAERSDVGSGAFLLREELPFIRVGAQGREEVWVVEGEEQSALTAWYLTQDEPVAKKTYFKAMAEGAASEIVRLLDLGQRGRAGFTHEGELKPLLPSDIAV